jgi:hypothetical protein
MVVVTCRVARWFILKPKNPNLGKNWRPFDWKKANSFCGHLKLFTDI